MEEVAQKFEAIGCTITHRWWNDEDRPEEGRTLADLRKQANLDINGVKKANTVVLINTSKSEGKAVEQGIAIANNIPIIAVGKRGEFCANVFHYLQLYYWVPDVDTALLIMDFISEITKEDNG